MNEAPEINGDHATGVSRRSNTTPPPRTSPSGPIPIRTRTRNPADTITWGIRSSFADAAHFNIGSSTGVLSFNMRPDFENPFGADNQYLVEVQADDGQGGVTDLPRHRNGHQR